MLIWRLRGDLKVSGQLGLRSWMIVAQCWELAAHCVFALIATFSSVVDFRARLRTQLWEVPRPGDRAEREYGRVIWRVLRGSLQSVKE